MTMEQGGENYNNEVVQIFLEEQLGRNMLFVGPAITAALIAYYGHDSLSFAGYMGVLAILIGTTVIWVGMLLRKMWPKLSIVMEFVGVAFMLLAFFGYLSPALPVELVWIPMLCFFVSLVPAFFGAARYFRRTRVHPENGKNLPSEAGLNMV